MVIPPPSGNIFGAKDPILAMRAVADWRADLRGFFLGRPVKPIVVLAAKDIALQIAQIIDRPPARIGVVIPVAPVAQRKIIVDADKIDVRIRPKRVEVEQHVPRSILRVVSEIF